MIRSVVVVGGGSAGLIAALTLKRRLPDLEVRVIRSPELGVIGVGEGTTPAFPKHLHEYLRLKPSQFWAEAQPIWKLGVRFLWGPRQQFNYTFSLQLDKKLNGLPKPNGFYCGDHFDFADPISAMMAQDKVFPPARDGLPELHPSFAYHIENKKLVAYLEARARDFGVMITDATVSFVERDGELVSAVVLESGERLVADFFVDASGFRSELLGRELKEPYHSFDRALFCDRAVIGGWARTDEPIKPYTMAETMNAGWCWQIEHEHWINRGYVYSSHFKSDDEAQVELARHNPKITETRVVKFRSGRHARAWVGNVLAVGNSYGFVEPLEASALMALCLQCRSFAESLEDCGYDPSPAIAGVYNRLTAEMWDDLRDFLAVHYRFNTRLDTPFWKTCREETDIGGAVSLVDYYQEHGPSLLPRLVLLSPHSMFGYEGYLVQLVGNRVPYKRPHTPVPTETQMWERQRREWDAVAQRAFDVKTCLHAIRGPRWRWK
ncbi:FAD-dependent oxidoreductase [Verrucomicrobiota bacterium sgz303538]